MFSWLRRKRPAAQPSPSAVPPVAAEQNSRDAEKPFETTGGRVAFTNGERTWEETFDCVTSLVETLRRQGRSVRAEDRRVLDEVTGLWLRPVLLEFQPVHNKGVRTCTKIDVTHPTAIPKLVFEFQHSTGGTMTESIESGFDIWSKTDLVALADATRDDARDCMVMAFEFPAQGERPAMKRRVLLGPVAHFRERPPEQEEEHPFCPCCLLTRSMKTFEHLLQSDGLFALRLYAMRGRDGSADADCRVNGEDFKSGKEALKEYASGWPQTGIEFRKQYVIIQDALDSGRLSGRDSAEHFDA